MKKKKEPGLKFNPDNYAHLNEQLPFKEWISEILNRNKDFISEHEALLQLKDHKEIENCKKTLKMKYKVHVSALPALSGKIRIAIPPTISVSRITDRENLTPEETEYVGCTPDEIISEKIRVIPTLYLDTLLMTINLNRPKEDIKREFMKLLHKHKKRKPGNFRPDKWKYHLIAYDLHKAGYTHDMIGDTLQNAFAKDNDTDSFSPETIRKYVQAGKNLVEKLGYLKYL